MDEESGRRLRSLPVRLAMFAGVLFLIVAAAIARLVLYIVLEPTPEESDEVSSQPEREAWPAEDSVATSGAGRGTWPRD